MFGMPLSLQPRPVPREPANHGRLCHNPAALSRGFAKKTNRLHARAGRSTRKGKSGAPPSTRRDAQMVRQRLGDAHLRIRRVPHPKPPCQRLVWRSDGSALKPAAKRRAGEDGQQPPSADAPATWLCGERDGDRKLSASAPQPNERPGRQPGRAGNAAPAGRPSTAPPAPWFAPTPRLSTKGPGGKGRNSPGAWPDWRSRKDSNLQPSG